MISHFSEHRLLQFYKALQKTHKNGHEAVIMAQLTKIPKILFVLQKLLVDLKYEHQSVKNKQISENFNSKLVFQRLFIKPGIQERGTECGECGE